MGGKYSKTFNPDVELLDLTGKVAIVTGGNSGVGFSLVQILARRGAKVYLAARNEGKATAAMSRLEQQGLGNGTVVWLQLDLANPKAVKRAAEEFLSKETRLDILINNAAKIPQPKVSNETTQYGILENMLVNQISPFVFTNALVPLMTETAKQPDSDVRIVNVASEAHTFVPNTTRFKSKNDLNRKFKGPLMATMKEYGNTKLCNILHINELQRRFDLEGIPILCLSVHPGAVASDGVMDSIEKTPGTWLWKILVRIFFLPSELGAASPAIAAASPTIRKEAKQYAGAYLVPVGQLGKKSIPASNPDVALELWETSEQIVKEIGV